MDTEDARLRLGAYGMSGVSWAELLALLSDDDEIEEDDEADS